VDATKLGGLSDVFKCAQNARRFWWLHALTLPRRVLQRGDACVRDVVRAHLVHRGA
jgi:hypothetical protein